MPAPGNLPTGEANGDYLIGKESQTNRTVYAAVPDPILLSSVPKTDKPSLSCSVSFRHLGIKA
jgi:hypothetical protein